MAPVTTLTSMQGFQEAINEPGVSAIIDFTAVWCGPCRFIGPVFEKLAAEDASGRVKYYKVDVDGVPDVAAEVGISAMPTFAVFQSGEKVDSLTGANPAGLTTLIQMRQ